MNIPVLVVARKRYSQFRRLSLKETVVDNEEIRELRRWSAEDLMGMGLAYWEDLFEKDNQDA
jgi:hypothetical protein